MSKTQTIAAKKRADELVKQLSKAKASNLKKVHDYQLPTKAHTSNKAKVAIAFSLVQGAIALTVITAAAVHKIASKSSSCCRPKVDNNVDNKATTKK
jgi:imidazolonepropionase-like amidohydrolase